MNIELRPLEPPDGKWIAEHQDNYPEAMREDDPQAWGSLIKKGGNLSVGCFAEGRLWAWSIVTAEEPESNIQVYWYDLSCLKEAQGAGFGKRVMIETYRRLRWHGLWVRMHCRSGTYPRSELGLLKMGYRIVRDDFDKEGYASVYDGIEESCHELLLAPIGR